MAEAHSAVAFNFTVTHEGVQIDYDRELLSILWRSGARSWKKSFARFINNVRNGLYPASHRSLVLVWALMFGGEISEKSWADLSFGLVDKLTIHLPDQLVEVHPKCPRTVAIIITGTGIWACLALFRRYMLKALFSYKGWMFESRGKGSKVSLSTRAWFLAVRVFEGSSPLLYSYQSCLPKLPLPSVADTMDRYLRSVQPLNDEEAFKRLQRLATEFKKGPGRRFQRYLWLKSWWAPNYVSDWWEEFIYLRGRSSIMVNSNFYASDTILMLATNKQCARAANLIHVALLFRRLIDYQTLKPILLQGIIPLCSAQYTRTFNTSRLPGVEADRVQHMHDSIHIAVYHKGRFYKVLTHYKGRLLTAPQLQRQLEQIVNDEGKPAPGELYLAALTATDRVTWAETRNNHFRRGTNRASLDAIEKAAFMVVLDEDDFVYDPQDPEKMNKYCGALLHGRGFDRWYDKSFTMIVGRNGRAGVNVEHSWADAPVAGHCWEYCIYHDHATLGYDIDGNTKGYSEFLELGKESLYSKDSPRPIRLRWDLNDECQAVILQAKTDAEKILSDVDLHVQRHDAYGKRLIKKCRVSPDAYLQMALQLAYFRDQGKFSLTYEASMTRLYREGRTETVRPVTMESCAWVRSMLDESASKEERKKKLVAACNVHQTGYQNAMCGKGFDRHMFCLYVISRYLEIDSPFLKEVLSEPWRLSTSQTPINQTGHLDIDRHPEWIAAGGGFGPVADDGYGVSYMIAGEDNFFFHISSKKSCPSTSSQRFANNICEALSEMKDIFA